MKRTIRFTDVTIRNLKPESKRVIWWAEGMPGFGLRVGTKGKKVFIHHYYNAALKKYRKKTYGAYPQITLAEARTKYSEDKENILKGDDPATEQVVKNELLKEVPTVNELINEWEAHGKVAGIKSIANQVAYVRRDLGRKFGHMRADKINKQHIREVNNEILKRGSPGAARESWQHTRCMYNYGMDWYEGIKENPAAKLKPPAGKGSCDRVLSPKEIYLFWNGINTTKMNPIIRGALKMILVTLQRGKEVRHAEWQRIIYEEQFWELPKEVTKNTVFHRAALNRYALDIIEEMKSHTSGCPYIFGISKYHKQKATPERNDLNVMRYETLSENTRGNCSSWGCEPFTPHDLRRSATTILTGVGVPRFFVKKALNHVDDDGATSVYDRYAYDYEKQKVAEVLEFVMDEILKAPDAANVPTVTELRKRVQEQQFFRH